MLDSETHMNADDSLLLCASCVPDYSFMHRQLGVSIPMNEMGAFDPWAWQFLWLVGIWMGVCWAKDKLPLTRIARSLTIPAFVVCLALLIMGYAEKVGESKDC